MPPIPHLMTWLTSNVLNNIVDFIKLDYITEYDHHIVSIFVKETVFYRRLWSPSFFCFYRFYHFCSIFVDGPRSFWLILSSPIAFLCWCAVKHLKICFLFVWCLTARQHWIGQFVTTAEGDKQTNMTQIYTYIPLPSLNLRQSSFSDIKQIRISEVNLSRVETSFNTNRAQILRHVTGGGGVEVADMTITWGSWTILDFACLLYEYIMTIDNLVTYFITSMSWM